MSKTDLNEAQIEAIANADAHTSNANLPTYSELLHALNTLSVDVTHHRGLENSDPLRKQAWECTELVCRAL